jgi:hypothetical protein
VNLHLACHDVFSWEVICKRNMKHEYKSCRVLKLNSIRSKEADVDMGRIVDVAPTKEKIEL